LISFSLISDRQIQFVLLIITMAVAAYTIYKAQLGKLPKIRELPAMQAIEECIGRATEMGKPVLYVSGYGLVDITSSRGAGHLAGLGIFGYIAERAVKMGVRVIAILGWPSMIPIAEALLKNAYSKEKRDQEFNSNDVQFGGGASFSMTMAVMGCMERDEPAAVFPIGYYSGEALIIAESGKWGGGIEVGGTDALAQMPFFAAVCDFSFIGPEIFAAEAQATGKTELLGRLQGEDIIKVFTLAAIVVLSILTVVFGKRLW